MMSMTFIDAIIIAAIFLSACLAVWEMLRDSRSMMKGAFVTGMFALALEQLFFFFAFQSELLEQAAFWLHWKLLISALVPSSWLLFSLSFARDNHQVFVARWKWLILASFALPLVLVSLFPEAIFLHNVDREISWSTGFPLGWAGYSFHVFFLLSSVLILANLEKTLRASAGTMRWRIKFLLLGLGVLFAVRIFSCSQVLLYSILDPLLLPVNAGALLVADLLILLSLLRSRMQNVQVYISQEVLYNSITFLGVGTYLLVVGVLAKVARYFGAGETLLQNVFFVFLALLGIAVILLSNQLRQETRRFISRHFRQPLYDYRKVWTDFTQQTMFRRDLRDLCTAVAKVVSDTFGVSSVSIWLLDGPRQKPLLYGSTSLSPAETETLPATANEVDFLMLTLRGESMPLDLRRSEFERPMGFGSSSAVSATGNAEIRYCVPLSAGKDFLGLMTLNERLTGEAFTIEDLDLLKTLGDQTAGMILNRRLFDQLGQAKEMETFQTLSAFFVHDLKNLASTLSLTLQNLPVHFDNPEFREDALKVMSRSVEKINSMCSRLSSLKQEIELHRTEADLNQLVADTLAELSGSMKAPLTQDLGVLPKVFMDPEQVQKVLINLLLNASEAMVNGGEIHLETKKEKNCVVLSVSDTGCGMTREFMERSLFHPFKTTKSRGLGIGLYQSRMIVEAHQGKIEVESEKGKGTTFRVVLPVGVDEG
ncbi:histidine kinase [Desulforhabdus sp. TSK]|nr:histidine kinase [Desulforhabdus sp. TSK]